MPADYPTKSARARESRRSSIEMTQLELDQFFCFVRPQPSGCWLWVGTSGSYGLATFRGQSLPAHRLLYRALIGEIPSGEHLDHLCRVQLCVNPTHVEPVSPRENILRGIGFSAMNAKKTHCPRGHAYDELNTLHHQNRRVCKACRAMRRNQPMESMIALGQAPAGSAPHPAGEHAAILEAARQGAPMRRWSRLTPSEVVQMRKSGIGVKAIAAKASVSTERIYQLSVAGGLRSPRMTQSVTGDVVVALRRDGLKLAEIAKRLGFSKEYIHILSKKAGYTKWTRRAKESS